MPELTCDSDHIYRVDGVVVPGVTEIIRRVAPIDYGPMSAEDREFVMQRGRAVHHATHLADQGKLKWDTVDQRIEDRVRSWTTWKNDCRAAIMHSELSLGHSMYRYAGTLDRLLIIGKDVILADIKSLHSPQDFVQIGFYSLLAQHNKIAKPTGGVVVVLSDDRPARPYWLTTQQLRDAERTALGFLTVFNFKQANSLTEKPTNGESHRSYA